MISEEVRFMFDREVCAIAADRGLSLEEEQPTGEVFDYLGRVYLILDDQALYDRESLYHARFLLSRFPTESTPIHISNAIVIVNEILSNLRLVRSLVIKSKQLKTPIRLENSKSLDNDKQGAKDHTQEPIRWQHWTDENRPRKRSFTPHLDKIAVDWAHLTHKKLCEPIPVMATVDELGFNIAVSATPFYLKQRSQNSGVCFKTIQDFIDVMLADNPFDQLQSILKSEVEQNAGTLRGKIANAALSVIPECLLCVSNAQTMQFRPARANGLG